MGDSTMPLPDRIEEGTSEFVNSIETQLAGLLIDAQTSRRRAAAGVVSILALSTFSTSAAAATGAAPLQVGEAVDALFASGLGMLIQFVLTVLVIVLSLGFVFLLGLAGVAEMSQKSQKQNQVGTYVKSAGICLAFACVVGAGPEILAALGWNFAEHVSPVRVFG